MNDELENKELAELLKQIPAPERLDGARREKILAALPSEKLNAQWAEREARRRIWHSLVKVAAIFVLIVGVLAGLLIPNFVKPRSVGKRWSKASQQVDAEFEVLSRVRESTISGDYTVDDRILLEAPVSSVSEDEGMSLVYTDASSPAPPPPASSPLSPKPAEMKTVAIVKSPIVMKGIVGSRSPGQRGKALQVLQREVRTSERALPTYQVAVAEEMLGEAVASEIVDDAASDWMRSGKLVVTVEPDRQLPYVPFVLIPTAEHPLSTFGLDTDTAGYTRSAMMIGHGIRPGPETIRQEEFINAFDYGDYAPIASAFRITIEGARSPFRSGNNLLRVGVKGRRLGREEKRPLMLTILLDASGSMETPERMPLAKKAILALLTTLPDGDAVTILTCSDRTRKLFSGSAWENPETFQSAKRQLDGLRCQGATNLEDGIVKAFESAASEFNPHGENRIVILSDGIANLGSNNAEEILKKVSENRERGIRCSVIGVGRRSYNDALLEALANRGDGQYSFLDSEQSIDENFVSDLESSFNTIASDVKIQVEWHAAVVEAYKSHGYDSRTLRDEQFRDDTVDSGEVGSGQGVTVVYEMKLADAVVASAVLGTVRIRYRRTDTGEIEEIERKITMADVMRDFRSARPQFRLACAVAEFATVLKHTPAAAQGAALRDVSSIADVVALELGYYTPAKEFAKTVKKLMGIGL